MVQINFAQKSVTVKIVYYGPGMSGKTTNLEVVHQRAPESNKGDLTSISTDGDRTLFFDFMPLDLGTVAGMRTQFQLYTVPGQVYYNSTRKLVLQGVDGVIFVADSSASMMEENLESLRNLEENLREYGKDIETIPMVIQYNKRDLPDALPVEELEAKVNRFGAPSFEAVANSGQGVFPTLKSLAANVLDTIHEQTGSAASEPAAPKPAAPTMAPPAMAPPAMAQPAAPQPAAPLPAAAAPAPMPAPVPAQQAAPQPAAAAPQGVGAQPPASAPMSPPAAAPQGVGATPPAAPLRLATEASAAPAPAPLPASPPASAIPPAAPAPVAGPAPVAPTAPAAAPAQPARATARAYAPSTPGQPGPGASVPGPRAGAAPAGRLRPRGASARAISATPQPSKNKSVVITAVVVAVAVAAGIAIGGAVFNLI
jgi:signal recognition particle receptor subunit beta